MGLGNITFGGNNIRSGAYADRPTDPNPSDWYTALDTGEILACYKKYGYHIETATYSQSINTQDTAPSGICFNSDGSKLYEVGFDSDKIYEYDVSTPYDISTATYSQSINTQDTAPSGITFNSDGTKLFEVGYNSDKIYEYDITKIGEWESIVPSEPIGTIKMFAGYTCNIPNTWQICDGTNGTPDLRDNFVVGAGNTYAKGDTGGEAAHTLTVSEMPSHIHGVSTMGVVGGSKAKSGSSNNYQNPDDTGSTGGDGAHENRPPYYALYYIMKISI